MSRPSPLRVSTIAIRAHRRRTSPRITLLSSAQWVKDRAVEDDAALFDANYARRRTASIGVVAK